MLSMHLKTRLLFRFDAGKLKHINGRTLEPADKTIAEPLVALAAAVERKATTQRLRD